MNSSITHQLFIKKKRFKKSFKTLQNEMKAATQPDNCVNNETLWFPERFLKFITQYIAF